MKIGVPKEIKPQENRIGLTPESVKTLVSEGHEVIVENNGGFEAGFENEQYTNAGAKIASTAADIFNDAEIIVKVKEPQKVEVDMIRENQIVYTYLHLAAAKELTEGLIKSKSINIAYETVTDDNGRLPLLAPMSAVAGRMSVQAGAHCLEKNQKGRGLWLGGAPGVAPGKVVILGGGVVGDLVGFAAAILRRGIRFIQCPTSLLAQVDSSVGGKTGINTTHGKNLVGAFYQPALVVSDISTLKTIKERDFLAGYGEVIKYGLLGDYDFYCWLDANVSKIKQRDTQTLIKAVAHSCEMKAEIVIRDEKEHGDRALLNLGHTFCHALEASTGYSERMLHGEGVAIGCILAFELSARMNLSSQEDPVRIKKHFSDMGMMTSIKDISGVLPEPDTLVELMFQDKKGVDGKLNLILAKGIGKAFIATDIDPSSIKSVIKDSLIS